jgi:hypothetical protein
MDERSKILKDWEESTYDPRITPPPDTVVFTIEDQHIGTLGNVVAFMGKPKQGKSLFTSALVASAFTTYDIWGMKITLPPGRGKMVWFDTESSNMKFHTTLQDVKKRMGRENMPDRLICKVTRRLEPEQILPLIELAAEDPEVSVIFVDGFLDVAKNFNDEKESQRIMMGFKKITAIKNVLIIGTIHLGKRDSFSMGHLGSSIERLAESTITVTRDETGRFTTASAGLLRNCKKDFQPIVLWYDPALEDFSRADSSLTAKQRKTPGVIPESFSDKEHSILVTAVMGDTISFKHADLVTEIMEYKEVTRAKARKFVSIWLMSGRVFKDADGLIKQDPNRKVIALDGREKKWKPIKGDDDSIPELF